MKPLLIAPRLPEDNNVWLFSGRRSDALHSALWGQSHAADRRDAELMLTAQVARAHGSWDPIAINRVGRFGGYLPARRPQVWLS